MYKQFKFLATLLLLAVSVGAWADEVTAGQLMTDVATANNWTTSSGNTAVCYTSFSLDENITISTTGEANCGSFWGSDWRLYQNKSGNVIVTAGNNCTLKSVSFTYSKSNNGTLLDSNSNIVATNTVTTISGTSATFTVGNTGTATNGQVRITAISVTYEVTGGGGTPTCATPTFSPAAGEVTSGTEVTISTTTTGATIYYTTDGTTPTTSSSVYSSPIEITTNTTIKAYAVMANYNDSEVATAAYTIRQVVPVTGYTIDFESDISSYTDWTFENVGNTNTAITAHGGSKYGANINASGNGTNTLSIKTNDKVALPDALTCYVSKVSTNTTASTWTVEVSSDGSTWTEVDTQDAKSMSKGEWVEFTANLSSYSDVYVRISYSGSTAIRAIDDISLTTRTPGGKVTPTVVINASSLTNDLAGGTNVSAGTATAAVMDGQTEVQNVSVTWSSSDTGVATIDAATGAVILIATGTTTLTATFAGNDDYNGASGTYELTVIDSHAPGSVNNPFTVAEAIAAVNNGTYNSNQEYYISGIVSEFYNTSIVGDGSNYRYYISDDGTTTTQLLVYKGKGLNQATFTNADDLLVGDEVTICGKLMVYNSAPEVAANNYLVSHHRKAIRYYLVGSFDAEPWIDHKIEMTKSGNTYTIEKVFDANTTFKIVKIDETNNNVTTWYGGATNDETYGIHSEWYANIPLTAGDAGKNFKIEPAGTYTFTVDADNMQLTVTGWPVPVYYLKGSFDNWGAGETFTSQGNGVYTLTKHLAADAEFKVVDENNIYYSNNSFSENNCTNLALYTNNNNMTTGVEGDFVFTLNTANNPMTLTVTGWPVVITGDKFVKVTSDNDLTTGRYLIVYETGSVAFDGSRGASNSLNSLDAVSNTIDVEITSSNEIAATAENKASTFIINPTAGSIKSTSGLYIGLTGSSNGLKTSETSDYSNSITFDNNNAVIVCGSGTLQFNKNSGQTRFRYFTSANQQPIQLYKFVPATTPAVTFSETDATAEVVNANAYLTVNATLTRTLSDQYWSTFSVPFDVDATQVKSVLGNDVEMRKFQGSEGAIIKFESADAIEAGHAYLVKPSATKTNPVFEGVTVLDTTGETDADNNGYGFVGAVIQKTLKTDQTELFLGTDGKFYYPADDTQATMKGLRGYFVVPDGTNPSKLMIDVDGVATAIDTMNIDLLENGNVYNMNGQMVGTSLKGLQKGIYLMNGKKYIVK